MDIIIQRVIDSIINDVRHSIEEDKDKLGYADWGVHLEEVRSFRRYRKLNMRVEETYHEAMKPYYWDYLTGKINYKVASNCLMNFLMDSFCEFEGAAEWIAEKGILAFVDDCLRNEYSCRGFQYLLQVLIELGYRRFIQDWPIDEINEYLERLEVTPDYRRGEYYCALSAFYLIDYMDADDDTKDELILQLHSNWDFLIHIYSIMVRSIVGSRLSNYTGIANTVKILKSCHHHIYLFYDALILRQDFLMSKYDGLTPKKKETALKKFDKHLVYLQDIMENTEQEDDMELLCSTIFGSEFEAAMNRKRFKTYKELEGIAEHWQQEATKLQGMVNELEPLRALCDSMRQAMENSIPMDVIVRTIIGFEEVKTSRLVFQELDWSLDKHPVWSRYRDEMKQLIDEKKHGAANLEMRIEELLTKIAKATQDTAEASKKAAERPTMNDNNGMVAGGNIEASIRLTDNQARMIAERLGLSNEQKKLLE